MKNNMSKPEEIPKHCSRGEKIKNRELKDLLHNILKLSDNS